MAKKKRTSKDRKKSKNIFLKTFPSIKKTQIYKRFNGGSRLTWGQWFSDKLAEWAGSWTFIISFLVFLIVWMFINIKAYWGEWDPYPFILLNLVLSCLAAIQAPVILMSQNRSVQRDRYKAERDYTVNRKAEKENLIMLEDLAKIKKKLRIR